MDTLQINLFLYLVIILSATFHEYSHGFVAYKLGDNTAKDAGRLTLNPLAHIDLLGTVIVPAVSLLLGGIFLGWAKPVPYNPYNLRDRKFGSLKVGVAGPTANLIIAFSLSLVLRLFSGFGSLGLPPLFFQFLALIIYINIFLALFNLVPMPPLDGSKILLDLFPRRYDSLEKLGPMGIIIAFFFAFYIIGPCSKLIFRIFTGINFGI
jgi:Zn-dependent protease